MLSDLDKQELLSGNFETNLENDMKCVTKSHRLAIRAASAIPWPSYNGTATLVGTTSDGRCTVYYDASLGAQALQNAQDLLADAPRVMAFNDGVFGTPGGKVNVIVFALGGETDGTGGADHASCDYTSGQNIEVDAAFGQSNRVSALFEAELSECSMNGNLCGESTGEGLSRWCAAIVSTNALSDFASAPTWAQAGYPNWVDQTENTDQDYNSTGCCMAFLSWVLSKKYPFAQVAQTMVSLGDAGTLTQLYNKLANTSASPWGAFLAAAKAINITSDDPFNGFPSGNPTPVPPVPPSPPTPVPPVPPSPPTPVPPTPSPAGGITVAEIDAVFAKLERANPFLAPLLRQINKILDTELGQITAHITATSKFGQIIAIVQWLIAKFGPIAVPIVNALVEASNLTAAEKQAIEILVTSLLSSAN